MSKSASHPVQLFPFLAVLICAMGALILLLLVTTRRMRHVAVEKAIEARQTRVAEELAARAQAPAPPVLPDIPAKSLDPAPLYVPPAAIQLARPVPVVDEVAEAKLRSEWKSIVDELARDYSDQVKLLAAIRADTVLKQQEQEAEKASLEEEKGRIEKKKRKAYSLRQETAADVARLEQDKALLDGELKKVKRATNIKAEELANQPTPYTLLPYDGALGTTRRPIILECNERSITFRCEGIELAASQLSGFPSEYNPLLAGTRALHEYWVVRDRETATLKTPPPPYVLLVVRPKGTVAYYVARKLLEKFEHPYGYELVEEGRELTWPASDDDAVRICREAVERALTERDRVLARLAGPGSGGAGGGGGGGNGGRYPITGDLRYDGQGGEFVTDEVEQLRNLDDSVVVGGQRWKREPRGNGGPGGGAGGGPLDPGPSTLPTPFQASRGGGRSGPGTGTPGSGNGGSGTRGGGNSGSANGGPAGTGPNQGEPGGASFGEAADSRLAAADPDSAGGGTGGGGTGTGTGTGTGGGQNGPEGTGSRSRSSGDSRSLGGSRTFEGSGGPRLGGGGSGDLHPYHDLSSRPSEPDAPQGTGPITGRNLPRLAHGQGRGTGSAQGGTATGAGPGTGAGTATSPPGGNIRGTGQGSGGAAGGSSENPGSEEETGLAGNGGTGGGTNSGDASADRTLASNGTGGSRGGAPGTGSRSRFSGQAGTGQAGSGDTGSGAQGFGAADAGASGFDPNGGGQAGSGASGGGTPGAAGGGGGSGGSAGGGGASSGMPGDAAAGSAPEGMPVPRNLRAIGQQDPSAKPGTGKAAPRRWGEPDHSGTIALERAVIIDVKEDGVTVEDEPELTLKDGTAYRELKDRLAFTLENHVGKWGRPPASFYWLPNVTFRIHPGGNQYYQAMKALTDDWGLHSKVEHVLE